MRSHTSLSVIGRSLALAAALLAGPAARGEADDARLRAPSAPSLQLDATARMKGLLGPDLNAARGARLDPREVVGRILGAEWARELAFYLLANPISVGKSRVYVTFRAQLP